MTEIYSGNYEQNKVKKGNEKIKTISSFDDAREKIEDEAKSFYKKNKNNPESIHSLREFLMKQENERGKYGKKGYKSIIKTSMKRMIFS